VSSWRAFLQVLNKLASFDLLQGWSPALPRTYTAFGTVALHHPLART